MSSQSVYSSPRVSLDERQGEAGADRFIAVIHGNCYSRRKGLLRKKERDINIYWVYNLYTYPEASSADILEDIRLKVAVKEGEEFDDYPLFVAFDTARDEVIGWLELEDDGYTARFNSKYLSRGDARAVVEFARRNGSQWIPAFSPFEAQVQNNPQPGQEILSVPDTVGGSSDLGRVTQDASYEVNASCDVGTLDMGDLTEEVSQGQTQPGHEKQSIGTARVSRSTLIPSGSEFPRPVESDNSVTK